MKTLILKSSALALVLLITTIAYYPTSAVNAQDPGESEYAILNYVYAMGTSRTSYSISYGEGKSEEITLTKEQMKVGTNSNIADVLNKLGTQGYTLVSSVPLGETGVVCFLKKEKR